MEEPATVEGMVVDMEEDMGADMGEEDMEEDMEVDMEEGMVAWVMEDMEGVIFHVGLQDLDMDSTFFPFYLFLFYPIFRSLSSLFFFFFFFFCFSFLILIPP